jgi:lipopolysaccharide transport system permease protein
MYASPVVYSIDMIPASGPWRTLYGLNPMTGVIQGFRWALLGSSPPDRLMAVSVIMVIVLLLSGLYYFRRMERNFADMVGMSDIAIRVEGLGKRYRIGTPG